MISVTLTGRLSEGDVRLTWPASSQVLNYAVHRAEGSGAFVNIADLNGRASSYTDLSPPGGTTSYRLRFRDRKLRRGYSNTVTLTVVAVGEADAVIVEPPPPPPPPLPPPPVPLAPVVTAVTPLTGAVDRSIAISPSATFDVAMDPASITSATFELRDSAGTFMGSTVTYDATLQKATLDPTASLANSTTYTAKVIGGSAGVKNTDGTPLAADYAWSFTTVAAAAVVTVVGYGSATTGGTGGAVVTVTSWASLKTACESVGVKIIRLVGANTENWSGVGDDITMSSTMGDKTIDGTEFGGEIKRGWFKVRASNVIFRQLRIRTGDPMIADYNTVSPILITGTSNPVRNILVDHCSILWGPEMCLTIYDDVSDLTVQNCIIGEALQYTSLFGNEVGTFHVARSLSIDIAVVIGNPNPKRLSFYRNLITTGTFRHPQVFEAQWMDWVNNVIYNGVNWSMHGNPKGLNYVSSVVRSGPETKVAGEERYQSTVNSDTSATYNLNSIYMSDVIADGFTPNDFFAAGVKRTGWYPTGATGPHNIPTVEAASAVMTRVAEVAGPTVRDATDTRLINNMVNRTSQGLYNATHEASGPYPSW